MHDLLKWLGDLLSSTKGVLSVLSVVLSVAAVVLGIGAKTFGPRLAVRLGARLGAKMADVLFAGTTRDETDLERYTDKRQVIRDSSSPSAVARARVVSRIEEAVKYRREQSSTEKWFRLSSNTLIIGQYIIGGVLASSFVQASLTAQWVGVLGIVVLIASLFKQQFHPELNAESSRRRASRTQALIRSSEDQLAILDARIAAGQDHTDAMIALMTQITQALTEIENPEAIETKLQPKTR